MIRVLPDLESISSAAAGLIAERAKEAVTERGRFLIALSGGSTPVRTYELLHTRQVPWDGVRVFWADERYVPPSDPSSNEGAARRALLDQVPIPRDQVYGMYAPGGPAAAADRYEALLRRQGDLDLCVLGMGADGHTASLFPGSPALNEVDRAVVATRGAGPVHDRITLTRPILASARSCLFLVSGVEKASIVRAVLEEEADLPAATVSRDSVSAEWLLDEAAASLLRGRDA